MMTMWLLIIFLEGIKSILSLGETSIKKCQEYSKAVYVAKDSPVLSVNPIQNTVSECGIVEVPLIVGGVEVLPKEFPHMAVIGFGMSPSEDLGWICGGSLISDLYVITAAHCLNSREKGPAQKVKLGVIDLDSMENVQEILVAERTAHPDYKPPLKYHDLGLIKLESPAMFTAFVRPACLNVGVLPNIKPIATGFGKMSFDSETGSKHLMKVQLSFIPTDQCSGSYAGGPEKLSMPQGVLDTMLCAGELSGGKDTCQGDSGGPLQVVMREPYCMYNIIGITSFGKFCGFPNCPAIYTKISSYIPWIECVVWGRCI